MKYPINPESLVRITRGICHYRAIISTIFVKFNVCVFSPSRTRSALSLAWMLSFFMPNFTLGAKTEIHPLSNIYASGCSADKSTGNYEYIAILAVSEVFLVVWRL